VKVNIWMKIARLFELNATIELRRKRKKLQIDQQDQPPHLTKNARGGKPRAFE